MKNLYVDQPQKDKTKLYTRFSRYCLMYSKRLQELIKPFIKVGQFKTNFNSSYYDKLNFDQKCFYGDCVDSLLSGGDYDKVNAYRRYFHQKQITPDETMETEIKKTMDGLLRVLNVFEFTYPRWKTTYYPDGRYKTHLDLIVQNKWNQAEVFDITINPDNGLLVAKMVELLALTKDKFAVANVYNLYNGCWYRIYTKSLSIEILNELNNLFNEFRLKRINEEKENS